MDTVYLDCAASAPMDREVVSRMADIERDCGGNAASVHGAGVKASRVVEKARLILAARLKVSANDLFFTSGGTEGNNWALKGAVWASSKARKHLVVSALEHPSILEAAEWLARTAQAEVTLVKADRAGVVRPEFVASALRDTTVLVSVMHVNNETGVVQPIEAIAKLCHERGALFHTDACQSFLKERLEPTLQKLDLVTLNAHKIHGPKGVGALYIRRGVELVPLFHGGGHEDGRRSGTLNVPAIAGFGEAVQRFSAGDVARMRGLLSDWTETMRREVPGFTLHAENAKRTCNIANFSIAGMTGKDIFGHLDRHGVRLSTSSACHSTKLTPSHVLVAMDFSESEANSAVRLSIGRFTAADDLARLIHELKPLTKKRHS